MDVIRGKNWVPFRKAGPYIFISGQVGSLEDGTVSDDPVEQMSQAYKNFDKALKQAGATRQDVVMLNQWYSDRIHVAEALRLRHEFFTMPFPASTGIMSTLSNPTHVLQLEGVAYVGEK